jgi:hypothetical protein
MKKLSLYIFLFLLTLTTISKAEVFIKCDHISGSLDKKIISRFEYLHLGDGNYSKNNIYGKMFSYSWDKKERKFYFKKVYKTRIQDYKIYKVYDSKGTHTAIIDRETGILTFSDNTFQCNKINESDLPIIEVKQKF